MMRKRRLLIGLLGCLVFLLGCGGESTTVGDSGEGILAIIGSTVIDGTGADPILDAVVLVEGSEIRAVGPRHSGEIPASAVEIDASGKFLIPGIVDLHAHPGLGDSPLPADLKKYLYYGVTTVRSIGVDGPEMFELRAQQRRGEIIAPRIYTAGYGFSIEGGWPPGPVQRPATAEEARELVRDLAAKDVDWVKMWVDSKDGTRPKIPMEMCEAIIDEARQHGIPASAHIFEQEDVRRLAELGITSFLHMIRDVDELDPELIPLLQEKNISFGATLAKAEGDWFYAENPEKTDDPAYQAVLSDAWRERLGQPGAGAVPEEQRAQRKMELARAKKFIAQMADAGIRFGLASDGGAFPVAHGHGAHVELRLMTDSGFTPLEAIQNATQIGADVLSRGDPSYGAIEPGKQADLVLLDADPLADIRNSREIHRVMQGGQWIDRQALLAQ